MSIMYWQTLTKEILPNLKSTDLHYLGHLKKRCFDSDYGSEFSRFTVFMRQKSNPDYEVKGLIWHIVGPNSLFKDEYLLELFDCFCAIAEPPTMTEQPKAKIIWQCEECGKTLVQDGEPGMWIMGWCDDCKKSITQEKGK